MVIGANAMKAFMTHAQLHWAAAGESGISNVTIAARQAIPWSVVADDGDFGLASALVFTGGAPGSVVYSMTIWSASAGGTFCGEFILSGDQSFNASGQYRVDAIVLDGSATWQGLPGTGDATFGAKAVALPNPGKAVYPVLRTMRRAVRGRN